MELGHGRHNGRVGLQLRFLHRIRSQGALAKMTRRRESIWRVVSGHPWKDSTRAIRSALAISVTRKVAQIGIHDLSHVGFAPH